MNADDFAVDMLALAGPLEGRLQAARQARFGRVVISPRDLVEFPAGEVAAIAAIRASGLKVCAFQMLRDYEGLSGPLHAYKLEVAKSFLEMCRSVGSPILVVGSSASLHADGDVNRIVSDLRKLAMLAVPMGIRIAYKALAWGTRINQLPAAWEIIEMVECANFGLALDIFQLLAAGAAFDEIEFLDPERIFLVQMADFMRQEIATREERLETARHFRVFPGEGLHNDRMRGLVSFLDQINYAGSYALNVFNDDYHQMPAAVVARHAAGSVQWLTSLSKRDTVPRFRLVAE